MFHVDPSSMRLEIIRNISVETMNKVFRNDILEDEECRSVNKIFVIVIVERILD
jgi:hypothetical protein